MIQPASESQDRVAAALEEAGDAAGTWLWRGVSAQLAGPLRIAVVGRDEALVDRVSKHLGSGCEVVGVVVGTEPDAALQVQDRLLPVHVLLFATPMTAPLSASEREWLALLAALGAPSARAVVVGDTELLQQMSDQPEQEAREVAARVRALTPSDWGVIDESQLTGQVGDWRSRREALTTQRRAEVGRLLLTDALRRAVDAATAGRAMVDRLDAELAAETTLATDAGRGGARIAAHLISAARRQTERLQVDLSEFLTQLEADLPTELAGVEDLDLVRRALPHWLHTVVEQFLSDRVATWRADLEAEIAELAIPPADLARAELLVPAVHASIPPNTTGWGKRLGVTAAMGGGAALLAFGLWIPGLLAVSGGALFSALGRRADHAAHRRALLDIAVEAVRKMGTEADRLLRDQIVLLETSLGRLSEERRLEVEAGRSEIRRQLLEERSQRELRFRDLEAIRQRLAAHVQAAP